MIIELKNNCSTMELRGDIIDTITSDDVTAIDFTRVVVSSNCGAQSYTLTVTNNITTIPTGITVSQICNDLNNCNCGNEALDGCYNVIQLTPSSFGLTTTTFSDGIYQVDIVVRKLDGTMERVKQCVFAYCTLKCTVAELIAGQCPDCVGTVTNIGVTMDLFNALVYSNDCESNCTTQEKLYQCLLDQLNNSKCTDC